MHRQRFEANPIRANGAGHGVNFTHRATDSARRSAATLAVRSCMQSAEK